MKERSKLMQILSDCFCTIVIACISAVVIAVTLKIIFWIL